ncbi:MAG: hypothetical protein ACRBHB_09195 [Arenicella sp.]
MVFDEFDSMLDFSEYSSSFNDLSTEKLNIEVFNVNSTVVIVYSDISEIDSIAQFMASAHKLYLQEVEMNGALRNDICLTFEGDVLESSAILRPMEIEEVNSWLLDRIGKKNLSEFSKNSGKSESVDCAVFYGYCDSMFLFYSNKKMFFVDSYPNG